MARNKTQTETLSISRELKAHIEALGVSTVEGYRRWCAEHGFSKSLSKSWRQQCLEREAASAPVIEQKLKRRRGEARNLGDLIGAICRGEIGENDVSLPMLKKLFALIRPSRSNRIERQAKPKDVERLFRHVLKCRAKFFDDHPALASRGRCAGNTFVEALVAIAAYAPKWQRPLEAWKPRSHNAHRQFASLIRHLFALYEVPSFLDTAWFEGRDERGVQARKWFVHVAKGQNVRHCDLPIALSKKMAHHFMRAPSDVSIAEALRWAQVSGLGGDERLARAVIGTRLAENFSDDEFWTSVIRWLIANPMLDLVHIGPIVDYLHAQKFVAPEGVDPQGRRHQPPQPNLSMKGRSPDALLRQVDQWHRDLARQSNIRSREWHPQPFAEFEFVEGDVAANNWKRWTIRELLTTKALQTEGRQMCHCVASYVWSCASGTTSIWTMDLQTKGGTTKCVTIEVRNQQRVICQIRGRRNRLCTDQERRVIERWASKARLVIAAYV